MPFHVLPRWHEAELGEIGEQKTLTIECSGLILVFIGYALIESPLFAAGLYVIDHLQRINSLA